MSYADVQFRAVELAKMHLGLDATSKHQGPLIDVWNQRAGVPVGSPWCAAFVWSMVDDACQEAGVPNPLPRTGACFRLWNDAAVNIKTGSCPDKGIGIHLRPDGHGHTFFVDAAVVGTPGYQLTVEGDTDEHMSGLGDKVMSHERPFDFCIGWLNLALLDGAPVVA